MLDLASGWVQDNNTLTKTYVFSDFDSAFLFAEKVRIIADNLNHHPDLLISWGKVVVMCTTHDDGNKITDKDIVLASHIDLI